MSHLPIAAQMYTVREAAEQNFSEALNKVAQMGYSGVELAGTFGLDTDRLARLLAELGLTCVSAHVPLAELRNNLSLAIKTYSALGAGYIVCPWLPPEVRGDEASYRALAAELDRIGAECRANGLQLCYHHHDFELTRFGEKYALDLLLEICDPANLHLEADTYWLKFGGEEPAAYIRRWPGRTPLIHLKDMTATEPPTFAEVGTGILNWPDIFKAAEVGQTKWYIVEQDVCPGNPFDSLQRSLNNLTSLLA